MQHNLVKVCSNHSEYGVNTPEELAQYISDNKISNYFPLTDYKNCFAQLKQREAAKKYGLTPIQGAIIDIDGLGDTVVLSKSKTGNLLLNTIETAETYPGRVGLLYKTLSIDAMTKAMSKDLAIFISPEQARKLNETPSFKKLMMLVLDIYLLVDIYERKSLYDLLDYKAIATLDVVAIDTKGTKVSAIREQSINLTYRISESMRFHNEDEFTSLLDAVKENYPIIKWLNIDDIYSSWDIPTQEYKIKNFPDHVIDNSVEKLRELSHKAFENKKDTLREDDESFSVDTYLSRIEDELNYFDKIDQSHMMLLMADIVGYVKKENCAVGSGRGALPSSLIAYLLNITDLNPIKYKLNFERIGSMFTDGITHLPAHLEFSKKGQELTWDLLAEVFGKDKVYEVACVSFRGAPNALRAAAKLFKLSGNDNDYFNSALRRINFVYADDTTVDMACANDPELDRLRQRNTDLFDAANALYGQMFSVSKLSSKVVFSADDLTSVGQVLNLDKPLLMLDRDDIKILKLPTVDLLGLNILDGFETAKENVGDLNKLIQTSLLKGGDSIFKSFSDPALLQHYKTGPFFAQSENGCKSIALFSPTTLNEISDWIALYRPTPMKLGITETYLERKNSDNKEWKKDLPCGKYLLPILSETYGVIVYQEQVVSIIHMISGFTQEKSEKARRIMVKEGFDDDAIISECRTEFINGAKAVGITAKEAKIVFELCVTASKCSFLKAHSLSYSYMMYKSAYMRIHSPAFYLTYKKGPFSRDITIEETIEHFEHLNVKIVPCKIPDEYIESGELSKGLIFTPIDDFVVEWSMSEKVLRRTRNRRGNRKSGYKYSGY
jgi:DNA polymerase III alpha subunit